MGVPVEKKSDFAFPLQLIMDTRSRASTCKTILYSSDSYAHAVETWSRIISALFEHCPEAIHCFLCRIHSRRQLSSVRESVPNPEISPDCWTNSRPRNLLLTTAIFMLGITVLAIYRTIFPGFERNFTLLFTVRTNSLKHLSRTSVVLSILKRHSLFLHDIDVFVDIACWLRSYGNHRIAYSLSFRLKEKDFFLGLGPRLFSPGRRS
jgi:hypothetical protein